MPIRLSDVLRALEDRGASLNPVDQALVWIDRPKAGCFVRAGDIRRIEPYYQGDSVWSIITVAQPDGTTDALLDRRRPKVVRAAVEKAELATMTSLLDEVLERFRR